MVLSRLTGFQSPEAIAEGLAHRAADAAARVGAALYASTGKDSLLPAKPDEESPDEG